MNEEKQEPSFGIMLSYGTAEDVVPVGIFKISRIIEKNDTSIKEEMIELVRVEPVDKELSSDDRVYMPLSKFIEMYRALIPQKNKESFYDFFESVAEIDWLLSLEKVLSDYLSQNESAEFDVKYKSLEDLDAIYVSNGEARGTNYSVMPYSLGKVKKLVLKKTPQATYSDDEPQKTLGSRSR